MEFKRGMLHLYQFMRDAHQRSGGLCTARIRDSIYEFRRHREGKVCSNCDRGTFRRAIRQRIFHADPQLLATDYQVIGEQRGQQS